MLSWLLLYYDIICAAWKFVVFKSNKVSIRPIFWINC